MCLFGGKCSDFQELVSNSLSDLRSSIAFNSRMEDHSNQRFDAKIDEIKEVLDLNGIEIFHKDHRVHVHPECPCKVHTFHRKHGAIKPLGNRLKALEDKVKDLENKLTEQEELRSDILVIIGYAVADIDERIDELSKKVNCSTCGK